MASLRQHQDSGRYRGRHRSSECRSLIALGLFVAVVVALLPVTSAGAATKSTSSGVKAVAAPSSTTVTADALPTAQIDGVVWSQVVVGDTVYAGGNFTHARPAGAAPGHSTVVRSNLLAYSISTGALITSFAPSVNAQVRVLALSPDKTRLYLGGDFTKVNGVTRNRIAAIDTRTGQLITTFAPSLNGTVIGITASATAVYFGGSFTTVGGVARSRLAAVAASNGSVAQWTAAANANVLTLVLTPDSSRVIVGGTFTTIAGKAAYGLVALNAHTDAMLPWNAATTVRDAGTKAGIRSLHTDGTAIYGTGFVSGPGGNLEGMFSADPNSGTLNWLEDCHGDSYDSFATGGQVYVVSHEHYCANIGAFPETLPRSWHRATAFSTTASGVATKDPSKYASFTGNKTPAMVNWFPDLTIGTFTGQHQAAWSVTGNSTYVALGGEFLAVNGTAQQGLVRFAVRGTAPSKQGPMVVGASFVPQTTALSPTSARISWPANWDRDDSQLTYQLVRNGDNSNPIWTGTVASTFWDRPVQTFVDTGLTPGATYKYRLFASDPSGNTVAGTSISYTAPTLSTQYMTYVARVLADGATSYYPLDDTTPTSAVDLAGGDTGIITGSVTDSAAGAVAGDTATTVPSSGAVIAQTALEAGPTTYSAQVWFRTSATTGEPILGFGSAQTATSPTHDRQVYLRSDGRLSFTVLHGTTYSSIVTPGALNDGRWHQVTATESPSGTALFVDGAQVGTATPTSTGLYFGLWRLGSENLSGWPSASSTTTFVGDLDEAAIYPTALSAATVQAQYVASGRGNTTSDSYASAVSADRPALYWRLDDAATTVASDASGNANTGSYSGAVQGGAAGALVGSTDTAAQFGGTNGYVVQTSAGAEPSAFSEEAWINTTTTSGGPILDFGDGQSSRDGVLYMGNDGIINFAATGGSAPVSISSTSALNDGRWHYLVASESATGLTLSVDGALVASSPQGGSAHVEGNWRVGADAISGLNDQPTSTALAGTIDEVAVYASTLASARISAHYAAGLANYTGPSPSFTSTVQAGQAVNVDASSSTDPGATITQYSWDFGDQSTATGETVQHSYAGPGTYTITLTVTDSRGATASTSQSVTITSS